MKRTPLAHILILIAFLANTFGPIPAVQAQEFKLPAPGVMVHLSPPLDPPILKGIKVYSGNPFRFDFILDKGDGVIAGSKATKQSQQEQLKTEATRLIKYFLASLTIPEKDLWVNLSPYEKDRIIPQSFGLTEMGRDLLAEDYMLKQITASLIYPEDEIGKRFWKRIYEEAAKKFGTTNIPVNTFNKVWIVPEKAVVYENAKAGTAYVVESKLKVMLEQDYLSLEKHEGIQSSQAQIKDTNQLGSQIVREVVIPELTKEVNEDKNFSQLRQVYNSLILATWYKKKIKDSILEQVYADKNKVAGVNIDDPQEKERIYERYLQAFKKGVYNYIKEEIDPVNQQMILRKYFSGGVDMAMDVSNYGLGHGAFEVIIDPALVHGKDENVVVQVRTDLAAKFKPALIFPRISRQSIRIFIRAVGLSLAILPFSYNPSLAEVDTDPWKVDSIYKVKLDDKDTQRLLSAALMNPNPIIRLKAVEEIMDVRPELLLKEDVLARLLKDDNISVRRGVFFNTYLRTTHNWGNQAQVWEILKHSPFLFAQIREDNSKDLEYGEYFLKFEAYMNDFVQRAHKIILADHSSDEDIKEFLAMGKSKEGILQILLQIQKPESWNRLGWFHELMQLNEWGDAVVQIALTNSDPTIRKTAAQVISRYRPDLLLKDETLVKLLSDPDVDVRRATTTGLDVSQDTVYDTVKEEKLRKFFREHPSLLQQITTDHTGTGDHFSDFLAIINKDVNYILPLLKDWPTKGADYKVKMRIERIARHLLFIDANPDLQGPDFQDFQVAFLDFLIFFLEERRAQLDPDLKDTLELLERSNAAGITIPFRFDKGTLRKVLEERENKVKDNYQSYFVVFFRSADFNGAEDNNGYIWNAFEHKQRVLLYQIGSKEDMVRARNDILSRGGKVKVFVPSAHSDSKEMLFALGDPQRGIPYSYGSKEKDDDHRLTINDGNFLEGLLKGIMSPNALIAINGCSTAATVNIRNNSTVNIADLFTNTLKKLGIKGKIYAPKINSSLYFDFDYDENGQVLGVRIEESFKPYILEKQAKKKQNFNNTDYANLYGPMFFTMDPSVPIFFNWLPNHDAAMIGADNKETKTGGIDLTPANMNLQIKMDSRFRGNDSRKGGNDSAGIKFHIDSAMLQQLQSAPGFVPVIINIQPLNNLQQFLGINAAKDLPVNSQS
jgi:hypothetical protein